MPEKNSSWSTATKVLVAAATTVAVWYVFLRPRPAPSRHSEDEHRHSDPSPTAAAGGGFAGGFEAEPEQPSSSVAPSQALCDVCKASVDGDHQALALILRRAAGSENHSCDEHSLDTPLHLAASHENVECTKILLAAGANPLVANKNGFTPDEVAPENSSVADVFENYFAAPPASQPQASVIADNAPARVKFVTTRYTPSNRVHALIDFTITLVFKIECGAVNPASITVTHTVDYCDESSLQFYPGGRPATRDRSHAAKVLINPKQADELLVQTFVEDKGSKSNYLRSLGTSCGNVVSTVAIDGLPVSFKQTGSTATVTKQSAQLPPDWFLPQVPRCAPTSLNFIRSSPKQFSLFLLDRFSPSWAGT